MLQFFADMLWNMPMDIMFNFGRSFSVIGAILAVFWWGLLIFLLGLAAYGIYYAVETIGITPHKESATVTGKTFTPAYTQMLTVNNGKTTSIIPIHHPDRWHMSFCLNRCESTVSFDVTKEQYSAMDKGDGVDVMVRRGRLSGDKYGAGFHMIAASTTE